MGRVTGQRNADGRALVHTDCSDCLTNGSNGTPDETVNIFFGVTDDRSDI